MKHAMCDEIVHGHVGIKLVGRFLKKKVQQSFDFIRNFKKASYAIVCFVSQ